MTSISTLKSTDAARSVFSSPHVVSAQQDGGTLLPWQRKFLTGVVTFVYIRILRRWAFWRGQDGVWIGGVAPRQIMIVEPSLTLWRSA
eukprot:2601032-Pleurochrysis_carterae.AAC.1